MTSRTAVRASVAALRSTVCLIPVLAMAIAPSLASAQEWPAKQAIKAIIPFPPGTTTDAIGRLVMDEVSRQIGQTIVPENRPGAATTIGSNAVAKAEPDGYTLLIVSSSYSITPHTFSNLPYDPLVDLAPIMPLGNMANVLITNASRGYKTAADLVAAAKAKPGAMNYASVGAGTATHLTAERFKLSAGFEATHVAFKGTSEAITEILADRIDFYCSPILSVVPLVQDGKLSALAVSTAKRADALPSVPTSVEAGFPDSGYDFWIGAMMPGKTPQAIIDRMNAEINKALDKPELAKKLADLGVDQLRLSPAGFTQMLKREISSNATVVKAANIKAN